MQHEIDELYRIFQPYRLGPDFEGCAHCVDPAESRRLAAADLRTLTADDLDQYVWEAMCTWGDVRHFKHFLPRLLELLTIAPDELPELEILFGKLRYANWTAWPVVEQRAVDRFLQAYWRAFLSGDLEVRCDDDVDTTVCCFGAVYDDLAPWLAAWTESSRPAAVRRLVQFIRDNWDNLVQKGRLQNAFWADRDEQARQVHDWLKSAATLRRLKNRRPQLDPSLTEIADAWMAFDAPLSPCQN